MDYIFARTREENLDSIFDLYRQRIRWMDENGIQQWNVTDYLDAYPIEYYRTQIDLGNLYILSKKSDSEPLGAVVLLQTDDRWIDRANDKAYYIHNLVTHPNERSVGRVLLAEVEKMAIKNEKQFVRLDCAVNNAFLNKYYESMGYMIAGVCEDGKYRGNRREKSL